MDPLIMILILILIVAGVAVYFIFQADKKESEPTKLMPLATEPTVIKQEIVSTPNTKKWPVLAQIFIALAIFGGIRIILFHKGLPIYNIIEAVVIIVPFWGLYKFKLWGYFLVVAFLAFNIVSTVFSTIHTGFTIPDVVVYVMNGLFLWYLFTPKIRGLFNWSKMVK